jgi:hypothetical protein
VTTSDAQAQGAVLHNLLEQAALAYGRKKDVHLQPLLRTVICLELVRRGDRN